MTSRYLLVFLWLVLLSPAQADELEGDTLYRVTTVRAAPGALSDLIDWIVAEREHREAPSPLVMRHSQGDQWDLMVIAPANTTNAIEPSVLASQGALIAFEEDHYAFGPSWDVLQAEYRDNAYYHIEMFAAVAGKADELLQQRRMENAYLAATGLTQNMIFRRAAGSDVDVFTIGFHEDIAAFVAPSSATDEEKEAAARIAGFKERSDISFYLRRLISGHHDTLAVRVD